VHASLRAHPGVALMGCCRCRPPADAFQLLRILPRQVAVLLKSEQETQEVRSSARMAA
jgi:hypothetical protein